jgi:hypothetical protein
MAFYAERAGFTIDYDTAFTEEYRVVQLTPPARVLDPDRDGVWTWQPASQPSLARMEPARSGVCRLSFRTSRRLGLSWSTRA